MRMTALFCLLAVATAPGGEIAYVDLAVGRGGAVHVADTKGGAVRLVGPGAEDGAPFWSPDGDWIAFEVSTPEGRRIHVVRGDGGDGRTLPGGPWCTAPAWSTDGARLLYIESPSPGAPGVLRVMELNTGEVTTWGNGAPGLMQPVWMPFSELMKALNPKQPIEIEGIDVPRFREEARMSLAQVLSKTPPEAALAIRALPELSQGNALVRTELVLVSRSVILPLLRVADPARAKLKASLWAIAPNWTDVSFGPAGDSSRAFGRRALEEPGETSRIAFESNEGGDREILLLHKRGVANISNHRAADWNPVWSPDGDNLAFESFRGGTRGIYNVYADTAHVKPLAVAEGAGCWSPAWSPDGEHLAFISDRDGVPTLFTVESDGGAWKLVAPDGGPQAAPAWRPRPE